MAVLHPIYFNICPRLARIPVRQHPSTFAVEGIHGGFGCNNGGISCAPVEIKTVNKGKCSKKCEDGLGYSYLIGMFRSLGSHLLRDKIIYFTLLSFSLIPLGVLGLFWHFEYSDRKTRRRGAILSLLLPAAFVLLVYGLLW